MKESKWLLYEAILKGQESDPEFLVRIDRRYFMGAMRNKLAISIILVLLLTVVGGTVWSLFRWHQSQKTPKSNSSEKLASAEGWKISRMHGNKRLYEASIESFSVERAKMGPFAIGPLHVAHLKNVVVDFYTEGLMSLAGAGKHSSQLGASIVDALEDSFTDIKNEPVFRSRKIRVLDLMGIALNLWDREKRVFRISSDRATIDRKTGDIIFIGHASLETAENGSLISYRIRWVKKTSLFRIDDAFVLTKGDIKKEGRSLETDYLLEKIKYPIKTGQ